ncbi:MAG: putative bifunctional diguanylate cyclase/phosphodiesterase [Acidimicrobiales bacterium]
MKVRELPSTEEPAADVDDCPDAEFQYSNAQRVALGSALEARSGDIKRICQEKFLEQSEGISREVIAGNSMWDITSVAVAAIANWLQTGGAAGDRDRDRIASLGTAAATRETVVPKHARIDDVPPVERRDGSSVPAGSLSVALLTKLNLWWKDSTCLVLAEEAARLGTSPAVLQSATDMVAASCNSSMVRMAKRFDAELQELHERLSHLALHDPLTGLANRSLLLAHLDKAIGRLARHPGGLAVAFIDLDNFKTMNDAMGHAGGDELLTAMAGRFASQIRPGDTMARFGGDEFVALFADLADPVKEAGQLAERLHRSAATPIEVAGEDVYMTASVGVAVVTGPDCRSEDALARADATMYAVKRAGRNRVAVVEVDKGQGPVRFAVTSGLHRALERHELRLAYQPVYSSGENTMAGFEALLRWDHPDRGMIPPLEFIPVAEESGLMVAIGAWALEEACRQAEIWRMTLGTNLKMAVNISGRQLADSSFPSFVADVLARTGMKPELLVLEITESILLGEHSNYESVLHELKELGIRLSIDDFGTGYSCLAYLRRFPVDQLKVDRGFVKDVAEHGDTRIMGAVVRLAHDLGLEVVAEGVETERELATVKALGCDVVQGYLLGRPVPPNCIDQALPKRN